MRFGEIFWPSPPWCLGNGQALFSTLQLIVGYLVHWTISYLFSRKAIWCLLVPGRSVVDCLAEGVNNVIPASHHVNNIIPASHHVNNIIPASHHVNNVIPASHHVNNIIPASHHVYDILDCSINAHFCISTNLRLRIPISHFRIWKLLKTRQKKRYACFRRSSCEK